MYKKPIHFIQKFSAYISIHFPNSFIFQKLRKIELLLIAPNQFLLLNNHFWDSLLPYLYLLSLVLLTYSDTHFILRLSLSIFVHSKYVLSLLWHTFSCFLMVMQNFLSLLLNNFHPCQGTDLRCSLITGNDCLLDLRSIVTKNMLLLLQIASLLCLWVEIFA